MFIILLDTPDAPQKRHAENEQGEYHLQISIVWSKRIVLYSKRIVLESKRIVFESKRIVFESKIVD